MTFSENTHVSFTNDEGSVEVGIVKGHSGGQYTVQLKSGKDVTVPEDKVAELKVTSAEGCPVAGFGK